MDLMVEVTQVKFIQRMVVVLLLRICKGGGRQPHIIEVEKMENIVIGSMQKHAAVKTDGVCTSLTEAMGMGGGQIPMVTERQIVAMRGRGDNNEQQLEPNNSSCTNTITSVQKDNLLLEKQTVKIRQANKKGYAECEIGGVADLNYTSSTTRRGRVQMGGADKPNFNNGEYP